MKKLMSIILILLSSVLLADTNKRLITVSGTDYVEALPDTAYIYFNVSVEKDSPEEATEIGDKIKDNILAIYNDNGLTKSDILLDSSYVSEKYDYQSKKDLHVFSYSSKLLITDFALINKLRKSLVNDSVFEPAKTKDLNVNFRVAYELVENKGKIEKEALQKAYKKALGKVSALAKVNGLKYKIHSITESGTSIQTYRNYEAKALRLNAMAESDNNLSSNDTIPTMQKINAKVTVQAEII